MRKTIAAFEIPYVQLMDTTGKLLCDGSDGGLPAFARDDAELLKMYRMMTLTRAFDTKAVNLQRTGKLGTYPPALGHEATQVGVAAALRPEDCIAPVYREIGTQLWRGVRMLEIMLYWGGDERGNDFVGPRHDFPWCVPIATQTLHATGAAMAYKIRGEARCALAYIGDGGTSEGAFYEAINLAGVQKLPVIFVIVNNGWAISVPLSLQTATQTLAQKAVAAGIPGIQVDGNDVIAVRDTMEKAIARARSGEGPTVVEAITYRLSDHTTADDASRYRSAAEVEAAWQHEPLLRLRRYLFARGAWSEEQEIEFKRECGQQVNAAVEEYLATPKQELEAMFKFIYARMPRRLQEQQELARHYRGSGAH